MPCKVICLDSFIGRCYGHRFVSPEQGSHIRTGNFGFARVHWLLVRIWLFAASPPGDLCIGWRFLAMNEADFVWAGVPAVSLLVVVGQGWIKSLRNYMHCGIEISEFLVGSFSF